MTQTKILLARMSHETNTFSPVITDLKRFSGRAEHPAEGNTAYRLAKGDRSCLDGFIDVCERDGAAFDIALLAGAPPSGPVENDAFEYMCERILAAVPHGYDGLMLELHGAMVTKRYEDGEGELLRRIRAIAPQLPIAVALDMHANLYDDMIRLSTVVTGYHKYPHIDMYETGFRAGDILLRHLRGETKPTMRWGNVPMLPHVMRQGTDDFPNRELQARVSAIEGGSALAASLFTGFPHADISNAGLSVVVVTDNDATGAERLKNELLDLAWREREAFVYQLETIGKSMTRAIEAANGAGTGPVILLDHYDNCASGGTMDTTEVLAEILRQGLEDVAVFAIYDPEVVERLAAAGVGSECTVQLGGKTPMPALPIQSRPLMVTGRVKVIADGRFHAVGEANSGMMDMGKSVVLDTGKVEIAIISRFIEPVDPGVFTSLGILPERKRFLMLKSRIHYRRGFKKMARTIVECAGVGVCTSDYSQLQFRHVRRPVFPLDGSNAFPAAMGISTGTSTRPQ